MPNIEGKVATILSERELTINIGSDRGVYQGMRFKVLSRDPLDIVDPETNEKLGVVDREKVRVMAEEVNNKFTICKTYRKFPSAGSALDSAITIMGGLRIREETLKIEDSSLPQPLSEEESIVKIGDRVIQIEEIENK
jgi:hypothetical protein